MFWGVWGGFDFQFCCKVEYRACWQKSNFVKLRNIFLKILLPVSQLYSYYEDEINSRDLSISYHSWGLNLVCFRVWEIQTLLPITHRAEEDPGDGYQSIWMIFWNLSRSDYGLMWCLNCCKKVECSNICNCWVQKKLGDLIRKMKFETLPYLDSHIACGLESRTGPKDEVWDAPSSRFAHCLWFQGQNWSQRWSLRYSLTSIRTLLAV